MHSANRQSLWLATAVLAPCLVLTLLFLRLLDQEQQLESRRTAEAQAQRLANARQSLLSHIEPARLGQTPESKIAFRGAIRDGRVALAWEHRSSPAYLIRLEKAVQSKDPVELKALASLSAEITDEHGVPIAAYALPHIGETQLQNRLTESARQTPHLLSPMGLRLAALENMNEAGLRFQAENPNLHATAGQWLAWGDPLFLVGFASTERRGELAFRAIRAAENMSIANGQPLGDPFINLKIGLPAPPPVQTSRQPLIAMFALTIAVALIGGLLLLRDSHREKQLARVRTQFIAGISHELRTPLTALRIFIESMKMTPDLDPATRDEYLDTMQHETERLSRLVNNVLEFSRIERQSKTYTRLPISLQRLIESIAASLRPMMEHAGYKLETILDNSPDTVNADRDALEQAILNLLTNAMKYSGPSREIRLRVQTAGPHASIEVQDFGLGIEPAEQKRIFDSFYRVPSPENRSIQGAGLGLTLVRHVAEGHGGEVIVESQPGKGSTFRMLLPL